MPSFRCYDNSDVIATRIITNFHLYLIQLWWQFFQMFVYGDVVYAQTWQVLTLKNCIEPLSYASTAYVVASYGPRFCSTVFGGNLEVIWPMPKNFTFFQKPLAKFFYKFDNPEINC